MNSLQNLSALDLEKIADELYSPFLIGGIIIPNSISQETIEPLIKEIQSEDLFQETPHEYGIAKQRMDVFYIGEADAEHKVTGNFPRLENFRQNYQSFYKELEKRTQFTPSQINSIGIHRYKPQIGKITLHRDISDYVNLISIVNLKGKAEFYLSTNPEKPEITLETAPGSLILMRAPRYSREKSLRPYHGVGNVREERYSLILRSRIS